MSLVVREQLPIHPDDERLSCFPRRNTPDGRPVDDSLIINFGSLSLEEYQVRNGRDLMQWRICFRQL